MKRKRTSQVRHTRERKKENRKSTTTQGKKRHEHIKLWKKTKKGNEKKKNADIPNTGKEVKKKKERKEKKKKKKKKKKKGRKEGKNGERK